MKKFDLHIPISINKVLLSKIDVFLTKNALLLLIFIVSIISILSFYIFYQNGLGLAYNDARSHLDIGRRVVEGLKPGLAQLGSVWLPLPHLLMVPTVWNDFMWHTGLSGAIQSMISFVATAGIIYLFLKRIGVSLFARLIGVFAFVANVNILYLQSTAMTELLLLATTTAGVYELMMWSKEEKLLSFVKAAFWIMLSTLIRYDGWFLCMYAVLVIAGITFKKKGLKVTEGTIVFFLTLAGLGIALWFLWNQLIFKDALYFAFGPYSARAQQHQLEEAGVLATKGDLIFSIKVYLYALTYNTGFIPLVMGTIGAILFWFDKKIKTAVKVASSALFAPLIFNVLALYLGHSVLFVQDLSGNSWFNVRYGIMMMPSIAIYIGYLFFKLNQAKYVLLGILLLATFISFVNVDSVTLDDARVGSSQKNVTEVSGWLSKNAKDKEGFVLISAASHDAIIFSSNLPMSKFIHEGTGSYWESATASPDRWARWIIMRTHDENDQTFKLVNKTHALKKYNLVGKYPFADIYELKEEYLENLNTKPVLDNRNY